MKKVIAVLAVFGFLATTAHAQLSVGGSMELRWLMLSGDNTDDSLPRMGGGLQEAVFNLSGTSPDGTFRGMLQMTFEQTQWGLTGRPPAFREGMSDLWLERAFVVWQPVPDIGIFLGRDGDGIFGTDNLTRWQYHQGTRGVGHEDWTSHHFLIGHWDPENMGVALMLTPSMVPGLFVNFGVDLPLRVAAQAAAIPDSTIARYAFRSVMGQVGYALPGLGTVTLSYVNAGNYWQWPGPMGANADHRGAIGVTFNSASGLLPGTVFEIGGNVLLPREDDHFDIFRTVRLGWGVFWTDASGGFGVRHRSFITLGAFGDNVAPAQDTLVRFDTMPWVNLGGIGVLFTDISVGYDVGLENFLWSLNPYIVRNFGGGHQLRVGAYVGNNGRAQIGFGGTTPDDLQWAFMTGVMFSF